jgi:hypothetical protein
MSVNKAIYPPFSPLASSAYEHSCHVGRMGDAELNEFIPHGQKMACGVISCDEKGLGNELVAEQNAIQMWRYSLGYESLLAIGG